MSYVNHTQCCLKEQEKQKNKKQGKLLISIMFVRETYRIALVLVLGFRGKKSSYPVSRLVIPLSITKHFILFPNNETLGKRLSSS